MQTRPPSRAIRFRIVASIVLVLAAMLVPACHLHPLLDKTAPDHCAICVSMHVAVPVGVHAPPIQASLMTVGHVVVVPVERESSFTPRFAESRAPPLPAC